MANNKTQLIADIKATFQKSLDDFPDPADQQQSIDDRASELADAIEAYVTAFITSVEGESLV